MNDTEVIEIDYNQDAAVVQANELVRSKQDNLTLLEAKLLRLAISQIVKDDTDLKTYSCSVIELAKFLNISSSNIYRDIQSLSNTFMRKCIFIKTDSPKNKKTPNFKIFHWLDEIECNNGIITFKLSDSLKPYLVGLEKLFTMYQYNAILTLPTNHSIRFYELMVSYERLAFTDHTGEYNKIPIEKDEIVFTIDAIRDFFNCGDKYKSISKFFEKVIDPSIEAVKIHADMYVKYRLISSGKKITHIIFKRLSPYEILKEQAKREGESK
jgi:plasmid replication initiation protein